MRVLHVTHQYPPAIGGSERYFADLSEELAARGHQVDVFTSQSPDFHTWANELPAFERRNGVNIYRFRSLRRREYVWQILRLGLGSYWQRRGWWWEPLIFFGGGPLCPGMFWRLLRSGRGYDLVHLNSLVYAPATYGYWAARLLNLPAVITPHVHAEQEVTYNIGYQRAVLAGADHVLADTLNERDLMIRLGLSPDRISVGGVGLQPADYPPGDARQARQRLDLPQDAFVMLFLGRKEKYKGLEVALQAFINLRSRYPHLHFLLVGPETDDSRAMWPQYQGQDQLHVLGAVSDDEKLAALRACDCLVLPSVGEAFGIVFLEAWIMGRPVIGARILAVSAVIDDGKDGLLAAPDDAADLARCVAHFIDNPALSQAMGQAGRDKVLERYTVQRITDRVEAAYQQVLQARHARGV